ncbi:hypothetical protein [Microbacterium sp.]|uniref:hypothetical protein n=1 Tax=Microbacterium sp. TaxID=51671 RepID=UPI00333F0850
MRRILKRHGKLIAGIAAAILTVLACIGGYSFALSADLISWDCGGGSCATNDLRSMGLTVAILGAIAASVLGMYAVGLLAPAVALAATAFWFRRGLDDAVAAGNSRAETLGAPMTMTVVVFVVAGLCLVGWIVMSVANLRYRARLRRHRETRAAEH